jgi:hypothetical protein
MSCKKQNSLSLASTRGHSRFLVWPVSLVVLGFGVVPFALLYVLQQIWTVSLDCLFLIAIFLITKMVKFLHDHSHQFPLGPVIEIFIWIQPLLIGHLSYNATFLCPKGDLLIQGWLCFINTQEGICVNGKYHQEADRNTWLVQNHWNSYIDHNPLLNLILVDKI